MNYRIIGAVVLVLVLVLISVGYWYWTRSGTPSQSQNATGPTSSVTVEPIPPVQDLLASQNTALAQSQPIEDKALRANTLVSTDIRGYTMPTTRDEQLSMMAGTWVTQQGIEYVFDQVDLIQDRFVVTKKIITPVSITYTSSGWNNNILQTVGSDNKNATFVYEGASMVLQTQNISIILIRK